MDASKIAADVEARRAVMRRWPTLSDGELEKWRWPRLEPLPAFSDMRSPEVGLIMVRGRTAATERHSNWVKKRSRARQCAWKAVRPAFPISWGAGRRRAIVGRGRRPVAAARLESAGRKARFWHLLTTRCRGRAYPRAAVSHGRHEGRTPSLWRGAKKPVMPDKVSRLGSPIPYSTRRQAFAPP